MNRKKKLLLGTGMSLVRQIVSVICGFILPRAILLYYGSNVNGLVNSITQFLGFITMAECGVSSVVQANLYGPLAKKDEDQISAIFCSSAKFFRKIGLILTLYTIGLVAFYPFVVEKDFPYFFTALLIGIIAISYFGQYFFGMTYRILLNADQYSYIVSTIQIITTIINTILSIALIRLGSGIHIVKLVSSLIFVLQPLLMSIYVHKKYKINHRIVYSGEPIKQKWNGFAQHVAQIVATNTDTVVLTLFSTLSNVSIYAVYNLVLSGIISIFDSFNLGVAPFIGNLLARNEDRELSDFFDVFEWVWHSLTVLFFSVTAVLIVPFIKIYTKGVTDADYSVPLFAAFLTLSQAVRMLRTPYHITVSAAGHYKQTQKSSIIEATLNIVISVVSVFSFGLIGVAIGTLVAMSYRTCYLPWYLSKNILNRNLGIFIKHVLLDLLCCLTIIITSFLIIHNADSYFTWAWMAFLMFFIALVETVLLNLVFNKNMFGRVKILFLHK